MSSDSNFNLADAERLFDLADDDKNGELSRDEVKIVMTQLNGGVEPGEIELKNAFAAMDADGNGKIDKNEFLSAMQQWMAMMESQLQNTKTGAKRLIGSPQGSPTGFARKKATLNMANFFKQFAEADVPELKRRIEHYTPPSVDQCSSDLIMILRNYRDYTKEEKINFFEKATYQMAHMDVSLFIQLHYQKWEDLDVPLQIASKFLQVNEYFHFHDEKIELKHLFDKIFLHFTECDQSGFVPGNNSSIIRRVCQILSLNIPEPLRVRYITFCLQILVNYIPGPGFPCGEESPWYPENQLTRRILLHERIVETLFNILESHKAKFTHYETLQMLEVYSKCLQLICETNFEIADVLIKHGVRREVRVLLEEVLSQISGPIDINQDQYGLDAYATLIQNLLGVLAVLCGHTHVQERNFLQKYSLDIEEVSSILMVTGCSIQFLTGCITLRNDWHISMIYVAILWQYLLPNLPGNHDIFKQVVFAMIELLGTQWDLSPSGVQVIVQLLMAAAELMVMTETVIPTSLWDDNQTRFKSNFRLQFQVGFEGGPLTWPICEASFHLLDLLLDRSLHSHLVVTEDGMNSLDYFGSMIFHHSRSLLTTAEDTNMVVDFLCKCLDRNDLIDTLLNTGVVDAFFTLLSMRFKRNSHAISDLFQKHASSTYEIPSTTKVIITLKRFLERHPDRYTAFNLDHLDSAELLHAVVCRELRRNRLRLTDSISDLITQLEELVTMIVDLHIAGESYESDIMKEELKLMRVKWPKDIKESQRTGLLLALPKAASMDIKVIPLWQSNAVKGFDKGNEEKIFHDITVSIDIETLILEIGKSFKRPVHLFADKKLTPITTVEGLVKHLHSFVTDRNSTDKIYVTIFVDTNEAGTLYGGNSSQFDMNGAIGLSSRERELKKLRVTIGANYQKTNQIIEAFYDYFKKEGLETLDKSSFIKIMTTARDLNYEHVVAESIFDVFDGNKDGVLTLKEISVGFSQLMSGTPEDRLNSLFSVYDVDRNGTLDVEELTDMIVKSTEKSFPDARNDAKRVIDKNGGDLSLEAFLLHARSQVFDVGVSMSFPSNNKKSESKAFTQNKVVNEGKKGDHNPKSTRFCFDIFTEKSCKRGNLCNFRHDKQNITQSEKEEIKTKHGARFRD